jgi:hypothetical protein
MAKASAQERLILGETMNTLVTCPKCEKANRVALDKEAGASPVCGGCKAELPLHDRVQDLSSKTLAKQKLGSLHESRITSNRTGHLKRY